jgi:hypothetical protein
MALSTFPSGRTKGQLALTKEEHEWLLAAVPSGLATKYEAAAKLKVSIPTVNAWLKRPIGYESPPKGRVPRLRVNGSAPDTSTSQDDTPKPHSNTARAA